MKEVMQLELSLTEKTLLQQCESVIKKGLETFVEVGNALLTIRDERLYRETHKTFEDYCRGKWSMERRRAYQLMDAAEVVGNVNNCSQTLPTNEAQARPLVGLEPAEQREVWQEVLAAAPDGRITAKQVVQAAKVIRAHKTEERRAERIEKISEISRGNTSMNFPVPCSVVLCDPPWRYEHAESDSRVIENHYPTMELSDICALPFSANTTPDCVLFLWVTSPKLTESYRILEAWGMNYRTCAVWVKDKIGMGYYFRQQHELLLVATRGDIPAPPPPSRVSSVIHGKRTKHSAKPDIYGVIDKMYPKLQRGEMFSRSPRKGWHSWGNQA